ncbi:PREDICTED: myb-like protein Q [Rhagoletis zephyria]|uniref:myb-like protein Q n=1 Tax=Rhagoletis zephyria TaxID=28612 RepID=UPI0008114394|nr:PREDICTED: myb-like protein Q [Rhagoletis zephyria]XP_017486232.1 PREDICTED: myb-like protein Q [Rhagoletis zephyria]XP_017486233.1 PREDICTED: myb-like protein Q [Rhagoletis zephyria]XP_017486234.1 PREDICTED: myb-like protein Q [Rhagoletis zephyria]XP_017486235.1 PREDICTED: myb-like protein Q [Rhagoletis zephyria]XP_017486236.1 PREDICTED: myb-like protein Q [Rhagoletis zephyria]XP_017486237.1 PREDICTED: myb-like protein Q [Rhagoletis zephyria]XP_036323170.1 myb-like protein Q [Rhagoletis 
MSAGLAALNCDLRSYSRLWLGEFIELYQQEECLWHPKHPDYSNHSIRNKAYDRLVEKLKEVEPNPDRAMVVRKINSLRSAFRREFRKSSSKNNYETRLWYYDKLLFIAEQNPKRLAALRDAKTPKRSLAISFDVDDSMEFEEEPVVETITASPVESLNHSQPAEMKTVTVTSGECVIVKDEDQLQHQHQHQHHHQHQHAHQHPHELQQHHSAEQHLQHATATPQPQHATEVKVLEITSLDTNSQREIQQAVSSLEQHQQQMQHQLQQQQHQQQPSQTSSAQITQIHQQVPTIQIAREHLQPLFGNSYTTTATHRQEDEYDAIGMNVASKLRVMNPTQRIIAEKLISDVLFNGQLDNLNVNSTLAQ